MPQPKTVEEGGTGQTQEQLAEQQKKAEQNPPPPSGPTDVTNEKAVPVECPIATGYKVRTVVPAWFTKAFNFNQAQSVPNDWKSIIVTYGEKNKVLNVREDLHDEYPSLDSIPTRIGKKVSFALPTSLHRKITPKKGKERVIKQGSIRLPSIMSNSCIALWLAKTCDITGENSLQMIKIGRVSIPLTADLKAKDYNQLGVPEWMKKG